MNKKERQLKALLQRIPTDHPRPGFTGVVMRQLQESVAEDTALQPLLAPLRPDTVPAGFTAATMRRVQARQPAFRPVIGRKGWWAIAAGVTLLVSLCWLTRSSVTPLLPALAEKPVSRPYTDVFRYISGEYAVMAMVLIAVGILLVMDFLLVNGRRVVVLRQG